jgi:hypothetical protein
MEFRKKVRAESEQVVVCSGQRVGMATRDSGELPPGDAADVDVSVELKSEYDVSWSECGVDDASADPDACERT